MKECRKGVFICTYLLDAIQSFVVAAPAAPPSSPHYSFQLSAQPISARVFLAVNTMKLIGRMRWSHIFQSFWNVPQRVTMNFT